MVKLYINEVNQMLDAGNSLSSENHALQTEVSNLRAFAQESQLSGQTWGNAKNVSAEAYIPLLQGKIAYNDAVIAGNKKVKSAVDAFPFGTPLDEAELVRSVHGYQQSIQGYHEMIREINYNEASDPTMTAYYEGIKRECQTCIDNLTAAIDQLNKQIKALHDFANSVKGAYAEADTLKGQLDKAVSALGKGGSSTYQNGQFTVTRMADWALSLSESYYKGEDFKFLSNLDTKGMNSEDKAEYRNDVSKQMIWLQENGWSDKGIQAYVKYLNKEYQNYNSFGPTFDFFPTDWQVPASYAFGAGKLVIQNIYGFLSSIKMCRVSEVSYRGAVNENIWTVTAPDGSEMTSAFLGFLGGYIPNLHYSQTRHKVTMADNTYAQNASTPYYIDRNLSGLSLPQSMYFLQNNFGSQLTKEQRTAIAVMHALALGNDAFEDAANPDRQQDVAGDLAKDTLTQVLPQAAGGLLGAYGAGLEADSLIPKLDALNKLSDVYRGVNVERMTQVVDNIGASQTRLTESQFQSLLAASDQNPGSKTTLLGGWSPDNASYEQLANQAEYNYYDMGSAYDKLNSKISGAGGEINEAWLDEKIKQGNDFVLSTDPKTAISQNFESGKYQSLVEELRKLQAAGYKIPNQPTNGLWRVSK